MKRVSIHDKVTGQYRGTARYLPDVSCRNCEKVFRPKDAKHRFCSKPCFYGQKNNPRLFAEYFWSKVGKTDECWEWAKTLVSPVTGYGNCWRAGKLLSAHRVSWELANGPIPDGLWVLHKCDNRRCVRPDHLFLGDNAANQQDAVRKGRHISNFKGRKFLRNALGHSVKLIYSPVSGAQI